MLNNLARRVKRWLALRNWLSIEPVIVFQMAKVGSSAIVAALQDYRWPVFHVHRMDSGHLHKMRDQRRTLGWSIPPVPSHDLLGLDIRRRMIDGGGRARIVTLVRDPIARNFSAYFEHLDDIWNVRNAHEVVAPEALLDGFIERYTHDEPLTWFDDEMLPVTGIDVYEHPFPAKGHLTIHTPRFELLVMKSELSDETKSFALAAFLGIEGLLLQPANRTIAKAKGRAYAAFVNALRLDAAFVDRMLESRYVKHFYTAAEMETMRRRYLAGSPEHLTGLLH